MVFFEHVTEAVCDSLWEEYGDSGAYSDELDVGDGVEAGDDFF